VRPLVTVVVTKNHLRSGDPKDHLLVDLAGDELAPSRPASGEHRHRQAVNGSRILLLGLAYKRNTGDARESRGFGGLWTCYTDRPREIHGW